MTVRNFDERLAQICVWVFGMVLACATLAMPASACAPQCRSSNCNFLVQLFETLSILPVVTRRSDRGWNQLPANDLKEKAYEGDGYRKGYE
jgi:hypothetical protein